MYHTNKRAYEFYDDLNISGYIGGGGKFSSKAENEKSPDRDLILHGIEINRIYGRIPVMTTAHDVAEGMIKTPKNDGFIVVHPKNCNYRYIFSEKPEFIKDQDYGLISFSTENDEQVGEVLKTWIY